MVHPSHSTVPRSAGNTTIPQPDPNVLATRRSIYHPDWPLSRKNPEFWHELGKTIAAFGYLEHELVKACNALTPPPALPQDLRREQIPEYLEWYAKLLATRTDTLSVLTDRICKLLEKDSRVPHSVRTDLSREFDELRPWRNALCHGAWIGVDSDGAGSLCHFYKKEGRVHEFQSRVTHKELTDLRARVVDAIFRLAEVSGVVGSNSAMPTVMLRMYEPQNVPPALK